MIESLFSIKQILIVSFAFIISLGMFQSVYASTNAFDDGWQTARSDFLDGYEKNSYCDPYNSADNQDLYCTLYKAGYEAGWAAAEGLYGNQ